MNHRVTNVTQLSEEAKALYNNAVLGHADPILSSLTRGIENLKANWKGRDAGVQIQNVVLVYNAMISIRNALAEFAADSSRVAANYREIQNANTNGAAGELSVLSYEAKSTLPDYTDNTDTVDINSSVNDGINQIKSARTAMDDFLNVAKDCYGRIMNNWQSGTGRDAADEAFSVFKSNVQSYSDILDNVINVVTIALSNYSM